MTTTMDAHIGLQNPPQEQARPNHLPANNPSPAQATSPENAETRPPDINHIDPRARKKLQNEQLRALRSVCILLDLLSRANARRSS